MKRILTVLVLALSIVSCKKEQVIEQQGNKVIYTISCKSCTAIIDTRNGIKEIQVTNFYQLGEINDLTSINITTIGFGEIKSSLKVNDRIIHNVINNQNGEAISYKIEVK